MQREIGHRFHCKFLAKSYSDRILKIDSRLAISYNVVDLFLIYSVVVDKVAANAALNMLMTLAIILPVVL